MGIEFNSKFLAATLDPRWLTHLVNGATLTQPGTNGYPTLAVDAARNHDYWIQDGTGVNNENCDCAKIYQRCTAGDLDLRTAITTFPVASSTTQRGQGIFVSAANFTSSYVIVNVYRGTSGTAAIELQYVAPGASTVTTSTALTISTTTAPFGIRLTRTGNVWRAYYSPNWTAGDNWNATVTWTQFASTPTVALAPVYAGLFVSNYRSTTPKANNSNGFLFFADVNAEDPGAMMMAA